MKRKLFVSVVCVAALCQLVHAENTQTNRPNKASIQDSSKHKYVNPVADKDVPHHKHNAHTSETETNSNKPETVNKIVQPQHTDQSSPDSETSSSQVTSEQQTSEYQASTEQKISANKESSEQLSSSDSVHEEQDKVDVKAAKYNPQANDDTRAPGSRLALDDGFPDPINFDKLDKNTIEQVSRVKVNKNTLHTTIRFAPDKNGHVRTLKYIQTKMEGGDVIYEKEEFWQTNRLVREQEARRSHQVDSGDTASEQNDETNREEKVMEEPGANEDEQDDEEEEEELTEEQKRGTDQ